MFGRRVPPPHRFQIGQHVGLRTPHGMIPAQIIQGTYTGAGWKYYMSLLNGTGRQVTWPEYGTFPLPSAPAPARAAPAPAHVAIGVPAGPVPKYKKGNRVLTRSYGTGLVLNSTFNASNREFKYKIKFDIGGTQNLRERHISQKNIHKPHRLNFNTNKKYVVGGKLVTIGNPTNLMGYKYYTVNYGNGKKEDVISNQITPVSNLTANKLIPNGSRVSVKMNGRNRTGVLKNGSGRGMNSRWNLVFNNNTHQVTFLQINKVLRYAPQKVPYRNQFNQYH